MNLSRGFSWLAVGGISPNSPHPVLGMEDLIPGGLLGISPSAASLLILCWASSDHSGLRVTGPSVVSGFSQKGQRSRAPPHLSPQSLNPQHCYCPSVFFTRSTPTQTLQNKGENPTVLLLTSYSRQLVSYFLII